ncbi:MAG TPA: 16S rRNA (cytosine(1402)-N(4))-methyltransferase RsmH [Chthoniobacteraceae bacterium]|nr:16S rRNA (cytosine(1402)-N(4))-methyltransferase RsmH [Chthoniobacteraceae bacterium]
MIRMLNFELEAGHVPGGRGENIMMPQDEHKGYHEPVLLREAVEFIAPTPGRLVVDGTLGGGGHSEAFLAAGARVIGIDQDPEALAFASARIGETGGRFRAVRANFSEVEQVLNRLDIGPIDGGLLDLGVSSWQLDTAARGFSFMREGALDMRMDPAAATTAADIVNNASAEQLEGIFRNFGEEPAARRIAQRIVAAREKRPFATTLELAGVVEQASPRRGRTHPATRVFQALRIAVNRELEALTEALEQFGRRLTPGGRLGVITFHSLEDRIVKHYFKERSTEWIDRPEWPQPRANPLRIFKLLTPKPVIPGEEEQQRNPRSRSAKLRIVEKI